MRFRWTVAALILAVGPLASSCTEPTAPGPVMGLTLSPPTATIESGTTLPLTAEPVSGSGRILRGRVVTWSSSDPTVAEISTAGVLRAAAIIDANPRTVDITASSEGVSATASVTVRPLRIARIVSVPADLVLDVGATAQLQVQAQAADGTVLVGRALTWSTVDTTMISLDSTGSVTVLPYSGGATRTATVLAAAEGVAGAIALGLRPIPAATVVIDSTSVAVGSLRPLAYTVRDAGGNLLNGRSLTWSSSDTTIAVVTPTGFATALPYGGTDTRLITVTGTTDGVSGTATVTVLPAPVVSVAVTPAVASIASGGSVTFAASPRGFSGAPLVGRTVTWASANPALATVTSGGVVTAGTNLGGTNVSIAIAATSGGVTGSATLSVAPSPVAALALSADSLSLLPGDTATLAFALANAGGEPLTGRSVVWTSTDTTVASVNTVGRVIAAPYAGPDARAVRIIASVNGIADTARLTVLPAEVATVDVAPQTAIVPIGAQQLFTVTARDAAGRPLTGRSVLWTSGTPGVTTIDAGGIATVLSGGNATVTASVGDASGSATVGTAPEPLVASTLVSGGYHNCALTNAGRAYCWGYNVYGQLGDGTTTDHDFPAPVAGSETFKSLAGGSMMTCGLTAAGAAWCWGWNANGQLGDGTHNSRSTPVPVGGGIVFDTLVAGWYHVCGLSSGQTFCWGRNHLGQLGDSTANDTNSPVALHGGHQFVSLASRYTHTCGLKSSGEVWCWGRNQWGALGDGTFINRNYPVRAQGNVALVSIKIGWDHTCGLSATGAAYCLGRNQYGQNADATTTFRPAFVPVSGGHLFTAIAPGMYHNCALTSTGESWCWGYNNRGQVGDGTLVDKTVPIHVNVGQTFLALSAGYSHACGMTTGGSIMCWGIMTDGLLGDAVAPPEALAPLRRVALTPPLPRFQARPQ